MKKKLLASSVITSTLLAGGFPAVAVAAEESGQKTTFLHYLLANPDLGVIIITLGIFGLVGAYALAPAPQQ